MKFIFTQLLILLSVFTLSRGQADGLIGQIKSDFTGGDADARTQLRKISMDVMAPPVNEQARLAHEQALLNGLGQNVHETVKAFLIWELQLVGRAGAVSPLAAYLADDYLCEPAAQALIAIYFATGSPAVRTAFAGALAGASGKRKVTLIKALGSVGEKSDAVMVVLRAAASDTAWTVKSPALRSLAMLGNPDDRTLLKDALNNDNLYRKSRIITWNLVYAGKLAEQGRKEEASAIANEIAALAKSADLGGSRSSCHVITAADLLLKEIPGIISVKKPASPSEPGDGMIQVDLARGLIINVRADGAYEIGIINAMGKTLWKKKGNRPGAFKIDRSVLQTGMYTVFLTHGARSYSSALVLY